MNKMNYCHNTASLALLDQLDREHERMEGLKEDAVNALVQGENFTLDDQTLYAESIIDEVIDRILKEGNDHYTSMMFRLIKGEPEAQAEWQELVFEEAEKHVEIMIK